MEDEAAGRDGAASKRSRVSARARALVVFAVGVSAFGVAMAFTPWQVAALIGWNVTALAFIAWVWSGVARRDAVATAELATDPSQSSPVADRVVFAATGASLLGVALLLLEASSESGAVKAWMAALAASSLVLSWGSVNTVFTLRYASLYYRTRGGIDFHDDRSPDYGDFAYLAFTIGMTYQVSDTTLTARDVRMTALRHAFLSFVFVTSVVAMTINVVASLFTG